MRLLTICSICAVPLLAGCHKEAKPDELYDAIAASAGIGVAFGSSPDVVHAKLGAPSQTVERGKMTQDFYIAVRPGIKAPEMPDMSVAQLTLTYYDKKLVAVLNSYHPEEIGALTPPIVAQPVSGVQLGMKRSEIEAKMGKPNFGTLKDGWQFVGADGGAVVIQPQYTKLESTGETLANALSIELKEGGSDLGRGEFYDKRRKAQESLHNLPTK
jgi:hypothetical protein